jgi:inner membrane protein
MPTILTHPAAALVRPWFGALPRRVVIAGAIATILPDADVAAFAVGIPYGATFGHRGFTHSILFALLVAIASIPLLRPHPALRAHSRSSSSARCRTPYSTP